MDTVEFNLTAADLWMVIAIREAVRAVHVGNPGRLAGGAL